MELNVVKKEDKSLLLELPNENVTMTNFIRGELWEGDRVEEAAHVKEHPYLENAKIFVKTSKGYPETALKKAADRLVDKAEEFIEKFEEALKE